MSNFVDYVKIHCQSGHGGAGSAHLRREKYIAKGGPDGGDGGRGGHVIMKGNAQEWTLLPLRYTRHIKAENGQPGGKNQLTGRFGEDVYIEVPVGTVARNENGEILGEILEHGQEIILMKGGKGGLGNEHFKSATNQTPRYAQPGLPGEEGYIIFELKVLADVGLVGFPNAGKSTLLNNILQQKIAIMSDKPQTTRNIINGVYTDNDSQIVFIDTPGIHKPKHRLGDYMMKLASSAIQESEIVYLIINASEKFGPGDQHLINIVKELKVPTFLLINKIDLISPEQLIQIIEFYKDLYDFVEIVPISALKSINVDNLLNTTKKYLQPSFKMYPDDVITDSPEYFVISEFIREKVLQLTEQEIPHSIAVVIDRIEKQPGKKKNIIATIVVERKSQKGMIIGKQGKMIKEIGSRARKDIEVLLGEKIFLELWVKVIDNWRSKPNQIRDLGYRDDIFD